MRIYRQFKDEKTKELVTKEEFIRIAEGGGYWKEGTAFDILKQQGTINTAFAIYTTKK